MVHGSRILRGGRKVVRQHHVVNIGEVARVAAVAVDDGRLMLHERHCKLRYHGSIGTVGVLPPAKDVEIAQPYCLHAVEAAENTGILLIDKLGDGVGRKHLAGALLHLGQLGGVAIDRRARGKDKPLYSGITRSDDHVQEPVDVDRVGCRRIGDAPRYAPQRRLVQHHIRSLHCLPAYLRLTDVALNQCEPGPAMKVCDILFPACGEVIEADHLVAALQEVVTQR